MQCLECTLCRADGTLHSGLCASCETSLPRPVHPCRRCACELPEHGPWQNHCESCLLSPPGFDLCITGFRYEFPVRELIAGFKFQGDFALGRSLAMLLADRLRACWEHSGERPVVVPVPLHVGRLRERGFNQSLLIARVLAAQCDLPLAAQHCQRLRATASQRELRAWERQRNLSGAFALAQPAVVLPHVLIVDDVVTTTSTVDEIARLYRRAGSSRVDVACLARVS
jgi:ComF family protein